MTTITIPKKDYLELERRQSKIEAELNFLKKAILLDEDNRIKPHFLKRWERISKDMDSGKGKFFDSAEKARRWLKGL